jgi:hypothetical protein
MVNGYAATVSTRRSTAASASRASRVLPTPAAPANTTPRGPSARRSAASMNRRSSTRPVNGQPSPTPGSYKPASQAEAASRLRLTQDRGELRLRKDQQWLKRPQLDPQAVGDDVLRHSRITQPQRQRVSGRQLP